MAGHEILHIRVTQGPRDGQDAVDAVVENQAAGVGDAFAFVLVATFVVVGEAEGFAVAAEDDARIADVGGVEDSLTGSRFLKLRYGVCWFEAGGRRVRVCSAVG